MVSMGLVGSTVTRQQERDQDKGRWCKGEVWGRCECVQGEVEGGIETQVGTEDRGREERQRRVGRRREGEKEMR